MQKLFTPIKIGSMEVKNRFMMAPMENGLAHFGGEVSDRLVNFFVDRVERGVGIIITGSISISPEGSGLPTQLAIYDEKFIAGLTRLCDEIHNAGGKIGAQLYHAGRQATAAVTGIQPIAPTAMPCSILGNDPREMTLEDMEDINKKFVEGAKRAVEAGFDLIEVHFAHGYLLHSFLSPHSNKRTDEYGGSFENRCRFPMKIFKDIVKVVDGKVPVTIRISADEYLEDGLKYEEVKEICKLVEQAGGAAISLTAGSYDSIEYCIQPMFVKQGFIIPYSEKLKKEVSVPVIVAARLNDASLIENVIEEDKADMVAIGRGLIADEDLIIKIRDKRYDEIKYCVACNQGCIDNVLQGKGINCLVNARSSYEDERNITKTEVPKKVVVIGAGPAGLEAARVAALRGHYVTLVEKEESLAKKIDALATPPEKETFLLYKDYLLKQVKKLPIDIVKKDVKDATDIADLTPDYVIVATGSIQIKPPILGINGANVVFAEDILNKVVEPKDKMVVIGGGLVGTETAKYLGSLGKKVDIIEMMDGIAKDSGATFVGHVFAKLKEYNVGIHLNAKVQEITDTQIKFNDEVLDVDQVVIASGYSPNNGIVESLKKKYDQVIVIGDASSPRRILDATREAYVATYKL
ncbi:MAG: FAD-dependent oxidoreductase [Peptostreptococcaceae bacterium]|nr:FAD-dependent oxidoreductase [Peptostreptococcaceae bacterium]